MVRSGYLKRHDIKPRLLIPNSKKAVTVLISKFRPAEKTTVAIFYEISWREAQIPYFPSQEGLGVG
ncbi:hypothetical protein D5R40_16910 [Okeania hirsuta]|uniref:Uncharacterized protein n=1 Tax=Okeania hirsuta TaxID=1458930 RepID=A0A3N6NUL8_9CYAN|nr:hypothetical protein D4Z78_09865 [Okeania hirsuta]RQH39576.1 hypothetical protein D5R40_16910 [Okeania hirsuta]